MLRSQLMAMCVMQNKLNSIINPDWTEAGYPWHRAIFVEAGEMLEHYGWKWWKAQTPDIAQVQLELVDIWHFILSDTIQRTRSIDEAATLLGYIWHTPTQAMYGHPADTRRMIEMFAAMTVTSRVPAVDLFRGLCASVGLSETGLYQKYVAKNVLNLFRQAHGYKDGSYIKVWRGHEDNEWLNSLMEKSPEATPEQDTAELEKMYAQVVGAA